MSKVINLNETTVGVFGADGMLGHSIMGQGHRVKKMIGFTKQELDITKTSDVKNVLESIKFDCIINCAAMTNVDLCEKEKDTAMAINAEAPKTLTKLCQLNGVRLIHYSTDFVFDGKNPPYVENDKPNPINYYGKTKLLGEQAVLKVKENIVIRTAWLFGKPGRDHISSLLDRYKAGERTFKVVYDVVGNPTHVDIVSDATLYLLGFPRYLNKKGVLFHIACSGKASKYKFIRDVFSTLRIRDVNLVPIKAEEVFIRAKRPSNTELICKNIAEGSGILIPTYYSKLREYLISNYLNLFKDAV
jgi:dTDP-4-dehydrorhamnose reductase